MKKTYLQTSEFVTIGHPDRMSDLIAASIINEIYKKDGRKAHAAIEVAIFDNNIMIGGEATTTLKLIPANLKPIVLSAVERCGYTKKLRKKFTKDEVYIVDDYKIKCFINPQSPDIALGTTDKAIDEPGWNDQGTYTGYADASNISNMTISHMLATMIGNFLFKEAKLGNEFGPDIKTLVTVEMRDPVTPIRITDITVAIPTTLKVSKGVYRNKIANLVDECIMNSPYKRLYDHDMIRWTINGTGRYVRHGSLGDSGVTGRKLVVNQAGNFAAGGSMIKPALASDRLLNIYARYIAKTIVESGYAKSCQVELSAAIGQNKLQSIKIDGYKIKKKDKLVKYWLSQPCSPNVLNELFNTFENMNFDEVVASNFFGSSDYFTQPWENVPTIRV